MSYRIGIDVGGTFTDFLLLDQGGEASIYKVSTTPADPSVGLIEGLKEMAADLGLALEDFVRLVEVIVHGTTVATNAVLTGSGARTGLITTEGFRDALQMRRGIREAQYDNRFTAPQPLVPRHRRRTVKERIDYLGQVRAALDGLDVQVAAKEFRDQGVEAVAVCLLHAYANTSHEKQTAAILRDLFPDVYLSISSELWPQIRFYDRTSTTVLNAYVGPIVQGYLKRLTNRLAEYGFEGILLIMQSNGGVSVPETTGLEAAATLLSGPAAGPVAGLAYAAAHNYDDCITIDMGGTSFDAALIVGKRLPTISSGKINGHLLALPMLDINTIGAGGGSIGWVDSGGLLQMGPKSAGAVPGPACYGRGGKLPTSTDADLVLGYLNPDYFLGGKLRLYPELAKDAIQTEVAAPLEMDPVQAAAGMFAVINNNMADGIREISVERGYDPRDFPLVVAGGAGPIHAAVIAQELEIPMLIVPRASSIFCAVGMLLSDLKHHYVRSYPTPLADLDQRHFRVLITEMISRAAETLNDEGIPPDRQQLRFSLDLRSLGQYHEINVPIAVNGSSSFEPDPVTARFHARHDQLYGYSVPETPIELVSIRLEAVGQTEKPRLHRQVKRIQSKDASYLGRRQVYLPQKNSHEEVAVYDGDQLSFGHRISGPAIIEQVTTTIFVPSVYEVECDSLGSFVLVHKDRASGFEQRASDITYSTP